MGGKGSGIYERKAKPEIEARHKEWREYKAQGHTNREVAEKFGTSIEYARIICRGVNPQSFGQWSALSEIERYAAETIRLKTPRLEYVGEYSGSNGSCKVRCKTCGAVFYVSWWSVRHSKAGCQACRDAENNKRKQAKAEEKAEKVLRAERERQARAEEKRQEKERKEAEKAARVHPCVICGMLTSNKYCCSTGCARKKNDRDKELRRRMKLVEAMVDKDISLEEVYRRDNGVCYLCGEPCDWEDKEITERGIFCGNKYPSIDHVQALANGGTHSWDNVRLAHRICNSKKSDSISPWGLFS